MWSLCRKPKLAICHTFQYKNVIFQANYKHYLNELKKFKMIKKFLFKLNIKRTEKISFSSQCASFFPVHTDVFCRLTLEPLLPEHWRTIYGLGLLNREADTIPLILMLLTSIMTLSPDSASDGNLELLSSKPTPSSFNNTRISLQGFTKDYFNRRPRQRH